MDLNYSIEEIIEYVTIATMLLLIGSGILFVADPDHLTAKAIATEVSYISTLINNQKIEVELNYDDTQLQENENNIKVTYDKTDYNKNYFGEPIKIETTSSNNFKISPKDTITIQNNNPEN